MAQRVDWQAAAAFLGFVVLAGGNGTAIAISNRELAPFWGAALRFLAAALVLLAVALARRRTFPRGRALLGSFLYGMLAFFGTFGLIYWALQSVKPGLAQIVLALAPLLTLLLAIVQRQERFRWHALAGALVCIAGIVYIFRGGLGSAGSSPLGLLALLGAAVCIAEGAVVARHFPKADIVASNAVAMAAAGALLMPVSLAAGEPWGLPRLGSTWIALAYLVLVGSVAAFSLFLFVLQRWTASAAAYQWVMLPLVALPVSAHFTGEELTPALILGGALVVAGVYVGAIWRRQPPASKGQADGPSDQS
jgi:drug/metabolite transporter (DMT)-like permease